MANARAAVEAIPRPLSTAVVDDPQAVRDAIAALGELQVFVQTDLINVLGLALRFNDNDGD